MNSRFLSAALAVGLVVPGFLSTPLSAQSGLADQAARNALQSAKKDSKASLSPAAPVPPAAPATAAAQPAGDASREDRRELLEGLDRVVARGPRYELVASLVRTSKAAANIRTVHFPAGSDDLSEAAAGALVEWVRRASVQAVLQRPSAMLIVLGFPDSPRAGGGGMPQSSARRAAAVEKILVARAGVKSTTASFGASAAPAREPGVGAEIWVIVP